MTRTDSLLNSDWSSTLARLGGTDHVDASARATKAFQRPRGVRSASDLLRLVLSYCLGERGLRLTAAWATAVGLADISNVALLKRLRLCDVWLEQLVGHLLATSLPACAKGRVIRLIDGSTVPKAARAERCRNGVWRIHAAFDLPAERFSHFILSDESGGERFDRIPVVAGEIRIADAGFLQPERIAAVLAAGGDVVVRAAWRNGRWLDDDGHVFDFVAAFKAAPGGRIDRPIRLHRTRAEPLALRLVGVKLPPKQAEAARARARREAQKRSGQVSQGALIAAEWIVLATSVDAAALTTDEILALYRLRWRIELAFKRLKSLIGLRAPPGTDPRSARTFILAHLLMILLLEPMIDRFEDSPRWAIAA